MDATHWQDVSDPDLLAAVAGSDAAAVEHRYHHYEKRGYEYVSTLI